MKLPLYKLSANLASRPNQGHAGLWFDKFCNTWKEESRGKQILNPWSLRANEEGNPKLDWIRTLTTQPVGDEKALEDYAFRLAGLVHALGGQMLVFKTTNRLAIGLGRAHPIENGFTWHPTLGTPYLPGSSVKGVVRAWLGANLGADSVAPEEFLRMFGSTPRKSSTAPAPNACGTVVFFDAVPLKPVRLKADVMTVHYADYYQGRRRDNGDCVPPADWLQPEPIPFLTVAPETPFLFALAPRDHSPEAAADCRAAATWLMKAMERLGIGAKTAVGYGRMTRDDAEETHLSTKLKETRRQLELKTRLADLDPVARELEQEIHAKRWESNKNAFVEPGVAERWVERLEKEPSAAAIDRMQQLLDKHFPGITENPDRTVGKKNEPAYKKRWIELAKRLNNIRRP